MNKKKKIEALTHKIEFFYRNFGNTWSLNDFVKGKNKQDEELFMECLKELEIRGIVRIVNDNFDFEIIDLPSNHNADNTPNWELRKKQR